MYPEARYSPCGISSYIPDSLGRLVKRAKAPVVAIVHRGNHLQSPFWNFRKPRKVPLHTTAELILTKDQIEAMSPEEIIARIREALTYDDYKYQKDNGILITEPYRAEGLNKILYQCPNCKTEHKMNSAGAELFCESCGKRWYMNEDSTLTAKEGETEFSHIPDWFEWEREQVRAEIERGEYAFEDDVEVYSLPRCYKYEPLGFGKLTHDPEQGFILTGHYRGKDYRIQRTPLQTNSLHVEYDFLRIKPFDLVDISTEDDSFYCYTTKKDVITKLAFATEEIYKIELEKKRSLTKSRI
jgi:DNA-directed RNA polymerase subunit RPC12/RpoP